MNAQAPHPFRQMVDEILELYGGLYTFEDIVNLCREGKMQSHVIGQSWMVTQVCEYPRKRALDVVFIVGSGPDVDMLHYRLHEYAEQVGADILTAAGRDGWKREAERLGWKKLMTFYVKDLADGT